MPPAFVLSQDQTLKLNSGLNIQTHPKMNPKTQTQNKQDPAQIVTFQLQPIKPKINPEINSKPNQIVTKRAEMHRHLKSNLNSSTAARASLHLNNNVKEQKSRKPKHKGPRERPGYRPHESPRQGDKIVFYSPCRFFFTNRSQKSLIGSQ